MTPDSPTPRYHENAEPGRVPPILPGSQPQSGASPPAVIAGFPPPLTTRRTSPMRKSLTILLNLCLGAFLIDAIFSLVDDSLALFFGIHLLAGIRGIVFLFALLMALVVYGVIGLTPMIPKRLFLPLPLFSVAAPLAMVLFLIYFYG